MTMIQITSAYLRYLPFVSETAIKKRWELQKSILIWSILGLGINFLIFDEGISYQTFRISLATGWIPYFIISVLILREKLPQHLFILGIQVLWSFMLHSFAGMTVALIYGNMAEEYLPLQVTIYLFLFVVLIKIERKFFVSLLPTKKFFEERSLKWYVAILPLVIFLGTLLPIVETTFLTTWNERLSRLSFPILFLLIYRSLSLGTQYVAEKQNREKQLQLMTRQMDTLRENNLLMEKNQQLVGELQKNLKENYQTLEAMLSDGKISGAMELISRQIEILDTTRIKVYCQAPLINAALSMYFRRAEESKIKVESKIDLPAEISTDESDLAVLLSNLLENAIAASKKQKSPQRREISLILRHKGGQNVLEIMNFYDYEIKIGENDLPYTTEIGHGLGMTSLEIFAKKYNAFVDFSHEEGLVRLSLYWNDYLLAK